jgi:hypothetical protein
MAERIVDACCLINLFASGAISDLLAACGADFYVPDKVLSETLTIRQPDPADAAQLIAVPIDLGAMLGAGRLHECQLEGQVELDAFVQFASQLDDGEACCLAIAQSRGWMVATDDRKAIRIAGEMGIAVTTTPELVKKWIDDRSPLQLEIRDLVRRIERFANFRPHRSSPLHAWWVALGEWGV